jgi:hypothetical protein
MSSASIPSFSILPDKPISPLFNSFSFLSLPQFSFALLLRCPPSAFIWLKLSKKDYAPSVLP